MNPPEKQAAAGRFRRAEPLRMAVLASGGGSNLQALLDRFHRPAPAVARVELVIASRAGVGALQRAADAEVEAQVLDPRELAPPEMTGALLSALEGRRIELVVLAGYMHLVPAPVVARFHGRMLNIHPALLPAFGGAGLYGIRVHRAVLASGVRVSGATVHLVDERYDTGPIVAQWPVPVLAMDTPEELAARVLQVEHRLLPLVVEAFASVREASGVAGATGAFRIAGDLPSDAELRALIRPLLPPALL
jgi:phosphoribosylglycinamide formyltransferase 1